MSDAELLRRLLATFSAEAEERLAAMSAGLSALAAGDRDAVESLFREAHNLKGAARAVNMTGFEAVCQALESVLSDVKRDRLAVTAELTALLQQTVDELTAMLAAGDTDTQAVERLVGRLEGAVTGAWVEPAVGAVDAAHALVPLAPEPSAPAAASEARRGGASRTTQGSVRVSTAKLDEVLSDVEALMEPRLEAERLAAQLGEAVAAAVAADEERARARAVLRDLERRLPPDGEGLAAALRRAAALLEPPRGRDRLGARLAQLAHAAEDHARTLRRLGTSLYADVRELQAVAFSTVLQPLARTVREMARARGKDVRLALEGADIRVDRGVLEAVRDPLLHLLRNAVDHGIEAPEVRAAAGKPRQGTVRVGVAPRDGATVEVVVADDGAGIDLDALRRAAADLLGVADRADLTERDLIELAFRSGVTTSPVITDLSGRGLGLAIVRERVEQVGGRVEVETRAGRGTEFRLTLPLVLATFRGVVARLGEDAFVVPSAGVDRVLRVRPDDLHGAGDRRTVEVDGAQVGWARLDQLLGLPATEAAGAEWSVAVVVAGPPRVALEVDEVIEEREVVVKPLGPQLRRVRHLAGATVLPDGRVAPVLNVPDVLQALSTAVRATGRPERAGRDDADGAPRRVLVVEDSITSRSLFKGILEAAGYRVTTAVDGIDAFLKLEAEPIDLIVTDVDMPRLNGLELTARVRADKRFAELPVILITSLGSPLDVERGVEAGANAYIVKSEFDQRGMLDTVRRLIG